jgi:hypothetical protein
MHPPNSTVQFDVSTVAAALASNAEGMFLSLLGKPTSRTRRELRYGTHGSLACCIEGTRCGRWSDFEAGTSGDLLDLIMRERRVTLPEAVQIVLSEYLSGRPLPAAPARPPKPSNKPTADREDEGKAIYWRGLWRDAVDLIGTPGHRYYEARGIDVRTLPLGHCIKWHTGISAVVALMCNPITGEPCGLHRTFLDGDAAKIDRRMIGRQGVVELSPREEVGLGLGLAEGIEDGMTVLSSGWRPVWVATSAGAIAKFPTLPGVESLTLFADCDEPGMRSAEACRDRWRTAGREAVVAAPRRLAGNG